MRETIASLLEVQELELVLEESRILHRTQTPNAEERALEERIASVRHPIPPEVLRRYDGLRRNGLAATTEEGGVCRACRLAVTVGDLNRMRNGTLEWVCPHCGRFLLLS